MGTQPIIPEGAKAVLSDADIAAIANALKEALEPLGKAQGDVLNRISAAVEGGVDGKDVIDEVRIDKALGKYPIGRKARAIALAQLEAGSSEPDAIIHSLKRSKWHPTAVGPTLKWAEHVKTTMQAGVAATAGDMVFPQYDTEWIELLRNNAVVRGLPGIRTVPMPRGATSRRKQTGAATAAYVGENETVSASNATVGRVNLSYKKLRGLSVVSNDLIRFAAPGEAERFIQDDLLKQSSLREDRAFLVGNPPTDAGSPKGIQFWLVAANVFANAGTALANFQADLTAAITLVQKNNVMATPDNSCFILSPSTFWAIFALATTTGDMIFAQMLSGSPPRIFGFPVRITTQLETANSFIGSSAGRIFFVHEPSCEIHDSMSRTVEAFRGGAYYDADTAAVVSGISNDETVISCIAEHDFLVTHDVAAAVVTGYST